MVSQRVNDIAGTSIDQKRGLHLILGRLASRYNGARKTQAGGQGKEAVMNLGERRTVNRGENVCLPAKVGGRVGHKPRCNKHDRRPRDASGSIGILGRFSRGRPC